MNLAKNDPQIADVDKMLRNAITELLRAGESYAANMKNDETDGAIRAVEQLMSATNYLMNARRVITGMEMDF